MSKDLDKQNSRLEISETDSLTWNINNEAIPRFGNTSRRDNRIFRIEQTRDMGLALNSTITLPAFAGLYFTANAHLSQFSQLAAVFDQYRVTTIEVWIEPTSTSVSNLGVGTTNLYSAVDYDSAANPTTVDQILAYENVIVSNTANGHYRKFKPHIAVAAYQGAFSGYQNTSNVWIDSASGDVQHYGVKLGIGPTSSNSLIQINYVCRMKLEFRNVI